MRRTGEPGRELMLNLHRNGDQEALETFVAMDDSPRTQRAFARAYGDGELDRSEAATALELMDANNPTAVSRMLRRMDDSGQEALLDEGLDQSQRQTLYETWRDNPDLTADEIGEVADQYQALDDTAQSNLDDLVDQHGQEAVSLTSSLNDDTLSNLLVCGSGTSSIGRTGIPSGGDRYHNIRQPSLTISQSGCEDILDTALENTDLAREDIAPALNRLNSDMERPVVRRIGRNPDIADSLAELENSQIDTLVDSTEGEEMADALELHASDATFDSIVSAAETDGVDLQDVNTGLQRYDNNDIDITMSDDYSDRRGDIGVRVYPEDSTAGTA